MVNYREILRLHSVGDSQRTIASVVKSSRDTVAMVLKVAKAAGVTWPLDEDVSNKDLQEMLFPGKYESQTSFVEPDYTYIHRELARNGVTLTLLWSEYCDRTRGDGGVPYMYTQFCEKYRRWARITKATMRISHKPGDTVQVDWAGDPLYYTDTDSGEDHPAYIFVAVLPCSWYTYADARECMNSENWLLCHKHAFEYFGGVPRLVIPDNCKTATTGNTRYETILNRSYQELAEHYGTAIVPARVRKPDDKAAAEGTVRFVSTWITAALRDRKFFNLQEIRAAVAEKLEELNRKPFKKRPGDRKTAFESEEKAFLRPLPNVSYEPALWTAPKVSYDYLVSDGRNKYSVPYDLIGETVDLRLTENMVEVYYKGTRVAAHIRQRKQLRDPVVKPEHMPENHRKYLHYNADDFIQWAVGIGSNTEEVVRFFLASGKEVEQGYKSCAGLTKLSNRYGKDALEEACGRVLKLTNVPTLRNISTLCKSNQERKASSVRHEVHEESHGITRGAEYYRKGGQHHD